MTRSDDTMLRLAEAYRELIGELPVSKVSVSAVARRAGVSRQAFYYHFNGLSDLASWALRQRLNHAVALAQPASNASPLLLMLLDLARNRPMVRKVMQEASRAEVERVLKDELGVLVMRLVEEAEGAAGVSHADRALVARFCTAGLVEIVGAWVDDDMREAPERLSHRLEVLVSEGMRSALARLGSDRHGVA